jgi:epoxyqueuosine reductase QueG
MSIESTHSVKSRAAVPAIALTREAARALALAAGFTEAGLVALPYAAEERDAKRFAAWVRAGRAGSMQYLERTGEDGRLTRERVHVPFPWARSALVCFASYQYADAPLSTKTPKRESAWIARYAWSSRVDANAERQPSDYHKVLLKKLREVEARLHTELGEFESRCYVDTGPVVERALAVAAGLGWSAKNTCLIHPRLGSWGFLAVLLTSLRVSEGAREQGSEGANQRPSDTAAKAHDFSRPNRTSENPGTPTPDENANSEGSLVSGHDFSRAEEPAKNRGALAPERSPFEISDHCGTCRRCIEACPTHALDVPYQMDATRCISYLTIEHKGPIAEELMPGMGRQVFGCDICQDVCPWNEKTLRSGPIVVDPELEPRPELINPALEWLASLDEKSFAREFNGSPVRRAGFCGLKRNVAIAMGNSGLHQFAAKLEEWAAAGDEGVRVAARWALAKLRT